MKLHKEKLLNKIQIFGAYASSVSQNENNSTINDETTTNNTGSSTSTETYTRHMEGDNGAIITNQRLVKEFREIIVAIDEEIIRELNTLFMGLYQKGAIKWQI